MYLYEKRNCIGVYDLETNRQIGQVILSTNHTQHVGSLGHPYYIHSFRIQRGELKPYWERQQLVALKKYADMKPLLAQIAAFPVEQHGMGLLKVEPSR